MRMTHLQRLDNDFLRSQLIQCELVDEPRLGDLRQHTIYQNLEDDLADDVPLSLRCVVFRGKTDLQDVVDGLAYIYLVNDAVRRDSHMGLKVVEEVGKTSSAASGVRGM